MTDPSQDSNSSETALTRSKTYCSLRRSRKIITWVTAGVVGLAAVGILHNEFSSPSQTSPVVPIIKDHITSPSITPPVSVVPSVPPSTPTTEDNLDAKVAKATSLKAEFDHNVRRVQKYQAHPFKYASVDVDKYVERAVLAADKAIAQGMDDVLHQNDSTQPTFTQLLDSLVDGQCERLFEGYSKLKAEFLKYESKKTKAKSSITSDDKLEEQLRKVLGTEYEGLRNRHDEYESLLNNDFEHAELSKRLRELEDLRLQPQERLDRQLAKDNWNYAAETVKVINLIFGEDQAATARNSITGDRKEYAARESFRTWEQDKDHQNWEARSRAEDALARAYRLLDEAKTVYKDNEGLYVSLKDEFKGKEREFRVTQFRLQVETLYQSIDRDFLGGKLDIAALSSDLVKRIDAADLTSDQKDALKKLREQREESYWNRLFDEQMLWASELAKDKKAKAAVYHALLAFASQPKGHELLTNACKSLKLDPNDIPVNKADNVLLVLLDTSNVDSNEAVALRLAQDWRNGKKTAYERTTNHEEKVYERQVRVNQNFQRVLTPLASGHRVLWDGLRGLSYVARGVGKTFAAPFTKKYDLEDAGHDFERAADPLLDVPRAVLLPAGTVKGLGFGLVEKTLGRVPYVRRTLNPTTNYIRHVTPSLGDPWDRFNAYDVLTNPVGANNGAYDGFRNLKAHEGTARASLDALGVLGTNVGLGLLARELEGGKETGRTPPPTSVKGLQGGETGGPRVGSP